MGKKKDFKINYQFQKHHIIYAVLVLIIIVLSIFTFNNYGKCRIYSLSTSDNTYKIANGVLVLTNQKNILKVSNIEYAGNVENIASVSLTLCVDIDGKCGSIVTMGSNAAEGMNLSRYLEKVSFDINETAKNEISLTKEIRKNIVDNLFLKVDIVTLDGKVVNDVVKVDVDKQYNNNKLIY